MMDGSKQFSPIHIPLDDDDSWSIYQEMLEYTEIWESAAGIVGDDQPEKEMEKGFESMKIIANPKSNASSIKKKINRKKLNNNDADQEGPSTAKKLDHNAKERIRRMKLNASYLALRALLPDSKRSKKRWCAPAIVDRVVKYIPELDNEVQALRSKKHNLQSMIKNHTLIHSKHMITTSFSINKVNEEEAVIQLCMGREDYEDGLSFTSLVQNVEDEGILVNSASANYICDTLICCHLHIQICDASFGVDYIEQLRSKIISWLR